MIKPDNFQEIYLEEINTQNINLIKRFFVFNNPPSNKSFVNGNNINHTPKSPVKFALRKRSTVQKFPAGFFQKNQSDRINQDSPIQQQKIILESKKAPQHQLTSFLLGFNSQIRKQFQSRQAMRDQQLSKTSPSKVAAYKNSISNIIKGQQSKNFDQKNLPKLEKKRDSCPQQGIMSPITEFRNNSSSMNFSVDLARLSPDPADKKKILFRIPQKIESKPQISQKIFQKGYMFYDKQGLKYWQQNIMNLTNDPLINESLSITAKSYLAINTNNFNKMVSKNCNSYIQIASLTKIMTCYLCILACIKYQIDINTYQVRVSDRASQILGTSAQLEAGDILTINQLLYGLMLPSGNDASVCLAQTIGRIIQKYKKKQTRKTPYQTFISHMNILSKQLKLQQQFQNSSGLSVLPNFSTPTSIAILSLVAIRNPTFKKIVNTKQFQLELRNQRFGLMRKLAWKNTNKLLWRGWDGIKTGTTQSAGHCLMSKKNNYLICVFDCQTLNKRFSQCNTIYETILEYQRKTL